MHAHEHSRARDRRLLTVALALIVGLMAGEVTAGILAGSLALLADAGHMLTDAAALAGALVAARLATRPARAPWTFGLGRAEILAAQANGITLLLVGIWIVYGAARRLPPAVLAPDSAGANRGRPRALRVQLTHVQCPGHGTCPSTQPAPATESGRRRRDMARALGAGHVLGAAA